MPFGADDLRQPGLVVARRPSTGLVLRPRSGMARNTRLTVPPKKDDDPSGFFGTIGDAIGDVKDAAFGIPAGLFHLGRTAGSQALGVGRLARDVATGERSVGDVARVAGLSLMPWQREEWDPTGELGEYRPLDHMLAQSFGATGTRLRHPTQYWRALDEGNIVPVLLEDAGNAALVAGPVAKGLTAASRGAEAAQLGTRGVAATGVAREGLAGGLQRAAQVAERVQKIGGAVSDSPISLPRRGVTRLSRGAMSTAERFPGLVERYPQWLTEEGRLGRREGNRAATLIKRSTAKMSDRLHRAVPDADRDLSLPDEGAALAALNGVADMDALALSRLQRAGVNVTPDELRQWHQYHDLPEQSYSPEAQAAVLAYRDGSLPPERAAAIDRAMEAARHEVEMVTEAALQGHGLRKGALDPAQLGDDPLRNHMLQALYDQGLGRADLQAISDMLDNGATWDDIDAIAPELNIQQLLDNPDVYPTQWRPAMQTAARIRGQLAERGITGVDIPLRPTDQLAAGLERPTYLPGGNSNLVNPKSRRVGSEQSSLGLQGIRDVSAENRRTTGLYQPYSLRALADHLGDNIRQTEINAAMTRYVEATTNRVGTIIDPAVLDDMRDRANRQAQLERAPASQADAYFGREVEQALLDQGYEVFHGNVDIPEVGAFDPGAGTRYPMISPDTVVLPVGVKKALEVNWASANGNIILNTLRRGNKFWKRNVLPLSIRWHLGDIVGGAFMSWVGGGIPPWELVGQLKRLEKMGPDAQAMFQRWVAESPEFVDQGLNMQKMEWMRDGLDGPRQARTRLGRGYDNVRNRSFRFNESINRWNRQSYVLAKLQKVLDERGLSLDDLGGNEAAWRHPEVQSAINEAVTDANKVMGTFDDLTPLEQRWIKEVFPFWVWQRHITRLAWRTAIDNPARMVWTFRLGQYGAEQQPDLPEWLKGSIQVGGMLIPTNYLNPFNDVVGGNLFTNPVKSMSPVIKLAAAGSYGADLNKGALQVTRPFGTGRLNPDTGAPQNTPLLLNPAEFAYYGLRMLPGARAVMDTAPTGEIAGIGFGPHPRYGQGTIMVNRQGNPIDTNSRLAAASQAVGFPWPTSVEDAENIMTSGKKRKARTKQAAGTIRIGL